MFRISLKEDVYPVSDFRRASSAMIKKIKEGRHPIVLTQRGRPAVVVMDVETYERQLYEKAFRVSYDRALKEAEEGKMIPHSVVMKGLKKQIAKWK